MGQIGIYGACYKLSIIMSLFIQAFKFAAEPFFFSKMNRGDAKQTYATVLNVYTLFLLTVFLGVVAYMDILQYFVGGQYRIGLNIVPILLMANLCLGVYYNLSIWYKVSDKTIYGAYISIIGAIITLLMNCLLVPKFGYIGAAWTTLLCYVSIMLLCYFIGQKYYPVNYPIKRLMLYTFFALLLFGLMQLIGANIGITMRLIANTLLLLIFIITAYHFDIRKLLKS